ncbi:MAG TPA: cytochrome P450 [Steroidobacteraceae bacterium]|nr:cytochrome P450 [Steroidobacteraceae bacterium]
MQHVLPAIDFGRDALPDLEAQLAALIEAGERVVPVRYLGGTAWLILRHEDVGRAFRDPRQFPAAAANLRYSLPVQGRTLLCMEGEEHRISRALVAEAFQPRAVQELSGALLRPLAHELIDAFGARRELDLVAEYCHRYPLRVIARLLGIPAADEEQLFAWVRGLFDYPFNPEAALRARDEVNAFLLPLIHERRRSPQSDLISRLAGAQVEGHSLSDEDILGFVKLLFPAGADTTYLTMGSMMNAVLEDEALRARLVREPALIPAAVEESVRLYGAVGLLPRYTETGARVGGVDIPPDSWVLFGVRPAGRDAAQYPDPERFELARHPQRLVSFGGMPHFCLGVHLAKAELATSLELLLARLPGLRLAQGPMPQTSAVLRGVRRLPVAFDALLPAH